MAEIKITNLHLKYGAITALNGIDFRVKSGEIACLLGASGSGKTTLLRAIAGLEKPSSGMIEIAHRVIYDGMKNISVPAESRGIGMVFQSYALWSHWSVFENVGYGLKIRKIAPKIIKNQVADILNILGLGDLAQRFPHQLSGGQQQRVAIARALVYQPALLLLDEPLTNLDAKLRDEARIFLRQLIHQQNRTAIMVTHDQTEAISIADRILLVNEGVLCANATPFEIVNNPPNLFSAEFIGNSIKLSGKITKIINNQAQILINGFEIIGELKNHKKIGDEATIICRCEHIRITDKMADNCLKMQLQASLYMGQNWELYYQFAKDKLRIIATNTPKGNEHFIQLSQDKLWIF